MRPKRKSNQARGSDDTAETVLAVNESRLGAAIALIFL